MVLAEKESVYSYEQIKEKQQPKVKKNRNKKPKKSYKVEKAVLIISLVTIFIFSVLVLTRFLAITEVKYRVNSLQYQIEDLKLEKEKLKIEVEKVSKSRWVEEEAKAKLDMDYPSQNQMIYINIDPTKVAAINNKFKNKNNDDFNQQKLNVFYSFFSNLVDSIRS